MEQFGSGSHMNPISCRHNKHRHEGSFGGFLLFAFRANWTSRLEFSANIPNQSISRIPNKFHLTRSEKIQIPKKSNFF